MSDEHSSTSPTQASSTPEQEERWPARLWLLLTALCLAFFLDGLDITIIGVGLPAIGDELDMSTSALQWVINGYLLGSGGFLLLGGRSADLLGRRRVFLASMVVFTAASLVGGLVDSGFLLIVTRFIKGVAAAFTIPTGLSIITTTFAEGRARNRAMAIYTAIGASGFSAGLVIGGLITSLGWRWIFLFPVPLGVLVLALGFALIPKDRPTTSGRYDLLGAATLTGSLLLLIYSVVTAPEVGWLHSRTLGLFAAAAVLLVAFVAIERRVANPLVRLGILRSGALVRANLALVALLGSYFSFQFILTLYLQDTLGWHPLELAFSLLPVGLIVAFGSPVAGKLIGRVGTPWLIVMGLSSEALGFLLLLRLGTEPNYFLDILPTTILVGIGFALTFPSASVQAVSGVEAHEQGLAAGLLNSAAQIGGAVVLAISTVLIADGRQEGKSAAETLAEFKPGLVFVALVGVAGVVVVLSSLLRRRATTSA